MRGSARRQGTSTGLALAELLVGLTIGLLTLLVVMDVMVMARGNQRVTSAASDALVNAAQGFTSIERDAGNAGFGLSSVLDSMGCELRSRFGAGPVSASVLAPVQIVDGPAGAPDTISFMASSKSGMALPTLIALNHAAADPALFVESDLGVQTGDLMIAVPKTLDTASTWCSLFQVAGSASGPNQVPRASAANSWNPDLANTIFPASGYAAGDYLINLGSFSRRSYSINNGKLHLDQFAVNNTPGPGFDVVDNVVQLQAVYGRDTTLPPDNGVDVWSARAPVSAIEWQQVRAIRMALVARASAAENSNVTLDGAQAASSCNSDTPHPAAVCWRPDPAGKGVKIDVSSGPLNWQHYRYRVFESTVALRNTIWQQ